MDYVVLTSTVPRTDRNFLSPTEARKFNIESFPTMVFIGPDREELVTRVVLITGVELQVIRRTTQHIDQGFVGDMDL